MNVNVVGWEENVIRKARTTEEFGNEKYFRKQSHIYIHSKEYTFFGSHKLFWKCIFLQNTHYARPNSPVMNHLSKYIDYSVYVFKYLVIFPNGLYPVHF